MTGVDTAVTGGERKYERGAAHPRTYRLRCLPTGDALLSEGRLGEEFGISRPTVITALDLLREEGLIYTRTGSGSSVRGTVPKVAEGAARPGLELLEGSEEEQTAEFRQAGIVVASPRVANLLSPSPPAKALHQRADGRRAVRADDLVPFPVAGTARSAASGGRSLITTMGAETRFWLRFDWRWDRRMVRPGRGAAAGARRNWPRPWT